MTFGDALQTYRERLKGDHSLKERSKSYRKERITALLKSWPDLKERNIAQVSKADCFMWAADFAKTASPSAFNNTAGTLRLVLEIAVRLAHVMTIRPSKSNGKNFDRSFCNFQVKSSSLNW